MDPSGIITITTDFGHKGPFTAVMKGVILSRFRDAVLIDLIHDIPAQWPPEAGFWVAESFRYFPEGSLHLAIVDPGVGTERRILLVECAGHFFMAPDNGLLARLIERNSPEGIYHLSDDAILNLGLGNTSNTFHGRDIFAPIAAELAAGRVGMADIGTPASDWIPDWVDAATASTDKVSGTIITVDTFGNLISNIEGRHIAGFSDPSVLFAGHELPMLATYGRATPGDMLALINSFDMVEIACAEGNAADRLGAGRGSPIVVRNGLRT